MAGRQMYTKASRHTDDDQASMLLDIFDSPHHNQTIRSSAKIAAIRLAGRARAQNNTVDNHSYIVNARRRMRSSEIISTIANGGSKSSSPTNNTINNCCAHFNDNMVQDNRNYTPLKHAGNQTSHTHQCQFKSNPTSSNQRHLRLPLFLMAPAFLVTLLLVVQTTLAIAPPSSSGTSASNTAAPSGIINHSEAKAEALIGGADNKVANDNSNQNVILIKYANVTKTKDEQQGYEQLADRLNVYQLYNEPLSVSVIESKFSHSIQLFDVSHNQLSTLSKDLFCPLSNEVRQLNISHNLLENFDCLGLISQAGQLCLSELRILDMSYNLVKHLPATGVATLHNLEVLNLSHNLIESLDELSLSSLFKLTRLDLSFNRIQQLPGRIFHKSTSMQVLRLQSNNLQNTINQAFLSGLISMEELNLSYNNISHVSESAFLDKPNLTRVDLSHNQLNGLRQEALSVTVLARGGNYASVNPSSSMSQSSSLSQPILKPRMHHNGQFAGLTQVLTSAPSRQQPTVVTPFVTEFYLSANPFICDCQLDWMRKFQPTIKNTRTVLSSSSTPSANRFQHHQYHHQNWPLDGDSSLHSSSSYQNDQPLSVIQQQQSALSAADPTATSNNISENVQLSQQQQSSQASSSSSSPTLSSTSTYGRIADLELIKCSPLFKRNAQLKNHQRYHSRSLAPSDGSHHNLAIQVHHANNHLHHHQSNSHSHSHSKSASLSAFDNNIGQGSSNMIDLLTADSSNFLCRYKSHCFALCHCCEFDACDCEMICPSGCNCYYDSSWQTNIIDCSSNNHTAVPERIPMDVSGLYLDGNNIDSLKPSRLIARRSLKTLYLNASNLQSIANRTFNGLIELQTLYLNDNMLRSLEGYEFEPLAQLKALYLQSNRLDHINNQTFIYLRSLEILDLSNNRLTSMNLDLFMSIGHHNIRLRQLTIAHNWWSCQCSLINSFRQILKQKFLVNGGVNIADRNQLRCYYNSTTVGPLILDGSASSVQQPVYGSFLPSSGYQQQQMQQNNRQQQLTEINQCSDMIEERPYDTDVNPPIIHPPVMPEFPMSYHNVMPPNDSPDNNMNQQQQQHNNQLNPNQIQIQNQNQIPNIYTPPSDDFPAPTNPEIFNILRNEYNPNVLPPNGASGSASLPLTSFVYVLVLFVCAFVVAISVFIFVRQQQRYHNHHHKKSSAGSTISVSSSASSTAISAGHHHAQNNHGTSKFPYRDHQHHHQHHLSQPLNYGQHHTLHNNHQHHLIMGTNVHNTAQMASQVAPQAHHQHTTSSQSNIYAALVSPTTGSSTIVTTNHTNHQHQHQNNNPNNLYSNSSTTASHHSSASSSQHINGHGGGMNGPSYPNATTNRLQHQQTHYGAPIQAQQQQHQQLYGLIDAESPYAINASIGPYKTGSSLHGGLPPSLPESNCQDGLVRQSDWITLPKVKQFMSKLVNKSLALSGYRSSNSRDEISAATSDKIYDAFLSYDKRDEPFVMQHLSAELEYGQPQYRVADRYRDLPLPTSAYIAEAITSVIGCSHRTIIVLSENYLTSDWCRYELQAALREIAIDKSHKIIAVVLDPRCLLDMDPEMHSLLASSATQIYTSGTGGAANPLANNGASQQTQQLVQLSDGSSSPSGDFLAQQQQQQQQLVTTLMNQSNGNQQVCTQTALASATAAGPNKITFINYNERKFWAKLKQLMPVARPSTQTLTLTTKN